MFESVTTKRVTADAALDGATWSAVRALCCRTGNDGAPIPSQRWELFGKIWIEPYQLLLPDWTYVALAQGQVVGYLTGCPDTASFARRHFVRCAMPLLAQVVFGRFRHDSYGRRFVRQLLGLEKSALGNFPRSLRRRIPRSFPAHLHMNVDADYRRGGIGAGLIELFVDDLRRAQIPGVHLLCGGVPAPFYARMGFRELAVTPVRGHNLYAMGLRL